MHNTVGYMQKQLLFFYRERNGWGGMWKVEGHYSTLDHTLHEKGRTNRMFTNAFDFLTSYY